MIFRTRIDGLKRGEQTGTDSRGNPIYGPDEEVVFYGELRPLQGSETVAGRDEVTSRFRLFIPRSITITAFDKITIDGRGYNVEGDPEPHNIAGRLHHHEVVVKRVDG